jgi:hypothetical protein
MIPASARSFIRSSSLLAHSTLIDQLSTCRHPVHILPAPDKIKLLISSRPRLELYSTTLNHHQLLATVTPHPFPLQIKTKINQEIAEENNNLITIVAVR